MSQDRSRYHRTLASEYLMEAANTNDGLARAAAYELAKLYQRLADELDAPVQPPPQAPAQPVAQQQQQIQPKTEEDEDETTK
jgi:hypothetical protein